MYMLDPRLLWGYSYSAHKQYRIGGEFLESKFAGSNCRQRWRQPTVLVEYAVILAYIFLCYVAGVVNV